jgi:PST family polysaccharide transporter
MTSGHITSISWLIGGKGSQIICALAVGGWVARYLGPDQFGVLSYCLAFVSLFGAIAGMGLDQLIIKHLASARFEPGKLMGSSFCIRLWASALLTAIALAISYFVQGDGPVVMLMIGMMCAGLLFQSADVIDLWYQSSLRSRQIVIPNQISVVISSIYEVLLVGCKAGVVFFAASVPAKAVIKAVVSFRFYSKDPSRPGAWRCDPDCLKTLLVEGWPLVITSLSIIIYARIDQVMIEAMAGPAEVGIYSAAARVMEQWCYVPIAVVQTLYPTLIRLREASERDYRRLIYLTFCGLTLICFAMSFLTVFFAGPGIRLLYGPEYSESAQVLAMLMWSSLFVSLGLVRSRWLMIEGEGKFLMTASILGAISNVGLNYWLIPIHGALGAAAATLISYGLASVVTGAVSRRVRPIFWLQIRAIGTLGIPAILHGREYSRLLGSVGRR